ncbi:hypothetical protein [Parasphingorhabdus pacifica]
MFVVVVAFLLVLILGTVMFTDVVNEGMSGMKTAAAQLLRGTGPNAPR